MELSLGIKIIASPKSIYGIGDDGSTFDEIHIVSL
jgi:hypothetical protein